MKHPFVFVIVVSCNFANAASCIISENMSQGWQQEFSHLVSSEVLGSSSVLTVQISAPASINGKAIHEVLVIKGKLEQPEFAIPLQWHNEGKGIKGWYFADADSLQENTVIFNYGECGIEIKHRVKFDEKT